MLRRTIYLAGIALMALAPAATAVADEVKTDLSKGGPTFQSGNNSLTIGARAQFRWTGDSREQFDADTAGQGQGEPDGFSQAMAVQRMRLILKGGMWKPWLKYEFQFDFANTSGDKDNKVKDAVIEVAPKEIFTIKMGQFKTPFSLQELTSSGRQEFVDRSITNAKFVPSRDTGVSVNGVTEDRKFGYSVGAFNGSGEAKVQEDQGLLYVARVWFDPFGEYKLSESANDDPNKNVFHVGFGVHTGEAQRGTATAGVFENPDNESAYGVELAWRYRRFFATGEYFRMTDDRQNPTAAPNIQSSGWHAQGGVMVVPKKLEIGARYAEIDPDRSLLDDRVKEERLVAGYYFQGHNLKLQADGGRVILDSALSDPAYPSLALRNLPVPTGARLGGIRKYTDSQYRVQMQIFF